MTTAASISPTLEHANEVLRALGPSPALAHAQALGEIMQQLHADHDIVLGAMLYPLLQAATLDEAKATADFGEPAVRVARELLQLGSFGMSTQWSANQSLSPAQAEVMRKMLLAIVTDTRLVLIKLADQLFRLREAKNVDDEERRRVAMETREIYAPLANRLGIWQLKWELEDLSFRYLEPEHYKQVASWLAAKRVDRERYIESVKQQIRDALANAGIEAEVAGRPKHIYSIWRKMQRKGSSFDELYDLRAIRVIVDSIGNCYAALGLVHSLWPYIPGEFDDYIATPKDNLYRSLHTAVIGPGKQPVEIQIRTREMHEHAELGVAAHWRYKEGGKANPAYEQKINWLRQVLEPADQASAETDSDFLERVRSEIFEDRVYALSPRGEVVDLPRGATPLDFAYHVHTDLGHRCRGAKVNGKMVPLTNVLQNGDQVEIVTAKQLNPSRDWLVPSLGYLVSPRNRSKVRAWFRRQDEEQNRHQGKQLLEREIQRLAVNSVTLPELIGEFNLQNAEQLYLALGEGEITLPQVTGAIQRRARPQELPSFAKLAPTEEKQAEGITIDGVDDLLSSFARCCRPVPPEPIVGYITMGRGVSIHRQSCSNLTRLQRVHADRVIPADWGTRRDQSFPVDINIRAFDRRGLLRDISAALADAKVNIHSMNTVTHAPDQIADIDVKISVHDLEELSRLLGRIQGLPNIISARRKVER
jgi:GTP pyrophosphokinase